MKIDTKAQNLRRILGLRTARGGVHLATRDVGGKTQSVAPAVAEPRPEPARGAQDDRALAAAEQQIAALLGEVTMLRDLLVVKEMRLIYLEERYRESRRLSDWAAATATHSPFSS